MKCPVCGSENVNVQVVTETELKTSTTVFYGGCVSAGGLFPSGGCSLQSPP